MHHRHLTPTSSPRSGPTSACATRARAALPARVGRAGPARALLVRRLRRRGSSTSRRPRHSDEPVVGYLGYDHVAKLEPTVPLPDEGPACPESRFVVADTLVRFDHVAGIAEVLARRPGRGRRAARAPARAAAATARCGAPADRALPRAGRATSARRAREGAHPRRRRVPDRALAARRAADDRVAPLALYRALRRINPSPYLFLLELDGLALVGSSPGDARQARGDAREPEPDRRHDRARRRRRRAAARLGEGPRRARDARRPRPQRPLARLPARAPSASSGSSSRSASRTSRTSSPRSPASSHDGVDAVRPPARDASPPAPSRARRRCGRCRSSPSSRATAAARTRAPSATRCPDGALDTCIAIRTVVLARRRRAPAGGRRDRRRLRPGRRARGVPAQARRARGGDRAGGGAAMILLIDNYDSFTYNLAHLFGELGAEVVVRRNDEIDADEAEQLAPEHLVISPGPGRPADAGATPEIVRRLGARRADARRLPRPPGDRRGLRRRGRPGAGARARQGEPVVRTTGAASSAGCPSDFEAGRYHSLAATRVPDCLEVSATRDDGEVMAVRHRELPVDGVQFHPESVLTPRRARRSRETSWRRAMIQAGARASCSTATTSRATRRATVMGEIMRGEATPAQIGGFLVALRAQGRDGRRDRRLRRGDARARPRRSSRKRDDLVDTAGTGGDGAQHLQHLDRGRARRRRRRARASRSTATARSRRRPARPTCSRRSASSSS